MRELGWVGLFFALLLGNVIVSPHLPLTAGWKQLFMGTLTVGIIAIFASTESARIRSMLNWRKLGPIELGHTLATAAVLFLLLNVYFAFTSSLGVSTESPAEDLSGAAYLATILWVGFLAPVAEELAFRGFVLGRLQKVLPPSEAIVLQAALFSVLHLLPWSYPSHFLLGLACGYLARATGSLYPPILLHALWNAHALTGIGFS